MSTMEGIKDEICLHGLIHSLCLKVEKTALYCDSQSVLNLEKNHMYHEKTNHIYFRLNFIRDIIEKDNFSILKTNTNVNPTNMLTKSLPTEKFKLCLD